MVSRLVLNRLIYLLVSKLVLNCLIYACLVGWGMICWYVVGVKIDQWIATMDVDRLKCGWSVG